VSRESQLQSCLKRGRWQKRSTIEAAGPAVASLIFVALIFFGVDD
jgi:hypothetical protein